MIPPRESEEIPSGNTPASKDAVHFYCSSCGRSYRIRLSRVPLTASAVYCKNCGKIIRFSRNPFPKPPRAAAAPSKNSKKKR
jgi:predicted Zn finger-like uncharacterized protein